MALKSFVHDGNTYTYEAEDIILRSGAKFSTAFPYDPVLIEELNLTTVGKVISYFLKHREELRGDGFNSSLFAIYVDRHYDNVYNLTPAQIRYYPELSYPALQISIWAGFGEVAPAPFILAPAPEGDTAPEFLTQYISIVSCARPCGRINIPRSETNSSPVRETRWNKFHNYTFKMDSDEFQFFRRTPKCLTTDDETMFGVELEICTKLHPKEIQYIVTDVEPRQQPFFIMKHDGSITGRYANKIELVTVPCTPRYLRQEFRKFFKKIEGLAALKGKTISHYFDTATDLNNGIHIHVSRDSFTSLTHSRKFMSVWQMQDRNTSQFLQSISRRPRPLDDSGYCRPLLGLRDKSVSYKLRHADREFSRERHTTVNCSNRTTLEVRLFQGIFDLTHLLRCIEVVELTVMFCRDASLGVFVSSKSKPSSFAREFKQYLFSKPGFKNLKEEMKCA